LFDFLLFIFKNMSENMSFITGLVVFICIFIYAMSEWGFLLGLAVGWLPALIGGFIAGVCWPIIWLIVGIVLFAVIGS